MNSNRGDKYKRNQQWAFVFLLILTGVGVYTLHQNWSDSIKLQAVAAALSWASSMGLVFFAVVQVIHVGRQADVLEQERNAAREERRPFIHMRIAREEGQGLTLYLTNLSRTPILVQHINLMDPQVQQYLSFLSPSLVMQVGTTHNLDLNDIFDRVGYTPRLDASGLDYDFVLRAQVYCSGEFWQDAGQQKFSVFADRTRFAGAPPKIFEVVSQLP
jgi:hypothetical protein